ncbi:MAG: zinc ribbon domain-containing protein [Candidatus Acidiferrales bacterium]|jgi:hypothetical protein
MPSVECPQCNAPTASTLGKKYCPQCGWNRAEAEKQTRLFLRLLPVLVIIFDAPLIVWIFIGHAEVSVLALLGAVAFIPAILVVLVVRGKVRMESFGTARPKSPDAALSLPPQGGVASIAAPNEEIAQKYRVLAELQRPRPVRMSRMGKINVAVISIGLLAFAVALIAMAVLKPNAASASTKQPPRPLVIVLPLGLVTGIALLMRRSLLEQRRLLTLGEMAMARVTKQWAARNGNGIRYEFTTPAGEAFARMSTDSARLLDVGMNVPIFYDRQEPKKQVALSAAFYEVALPEER